MTNSSNLARSSVHSSPSGPLQVQRDSQHHLSWCGPHAAALAHAAAGTAPPGAKQQCSNKGGVVNLPFERKRATSASRAASTTVILIHHGSVTLVDARGDRLRRGSAEFRGSLFDSVLRGGSWGGEGGRGGEEGRGGESSAVNEFGGPRSLLDGDCWKY